MVPLVQRYPDIDLTLIGQDIEGYGNELIKVIHDLGLEKHVRLSGFIPNASIYCECFDVCVIPSIAFECLPFVAIEAMRYNKPVVASRVGGLPEVVIDGETGFIIPAGDAGRLTNALDRLLASPDLRAQMGEKGHALFMNRFTSQEMAKSFYSLSHEQPTTKRDAVAELEPQP
jgi:glycosyltransferase involved in cell wall biosynthesis